MRIKIAYGHMGVDWPHPTKLIWETSRVCVEGGEVEFQQGGGRLAAIIAPLDPGK